MWRVRLEVSLLVHRMSRVSVPNWLVSNSIVLGDADGVCFVDRSVYREFIDIDHRVREFTVLACRMLGCNV